MRPLPCFVLPAVLLLSAAPAYAAQSYDSCVGFIDSLPVTLGTQGTWCLRRDLATSISTGMAIIVTTNNVTIDCNDFKIGGLAAGSGTAATGIFAVNRQNVTVRRCSIRGFATGVALSGEESSGHVVEDNRFDDNTVSGIRLDGTGSVARRNLVVDTGFSTSMPGLAVGIGTVYSADVIDNTIDGVGASTDAGNATSIGISTSMNYDGSITGNRIRGLRSAGTGTSNGIVNNANGRVKVRGNDLSGNGLGISCELPGGLAKDNLASGFATPIDGCADAGGNGTAP